MRRSEIQTECLRAAGYPEDIIADSQRQSAMLFPSDPVLTEAQTMEARRQMMAVIAAVQAMSMEQITSARRAIARVITEKN